MDLWRVTLVFAHARPALQSICGWCTPYLLQAVVCESDYNVCLGSFYCCPFVCVCRVCRVIFLDPVHYINGGKCVR